MNEDNLTSCDLRCHKSLDVDSPGRVSVLLREDHITKQTLCQFKSVTILALNKKKRMFLNVGYVAACTVCVLML